MAATRISVSTLLSVLSDHPEIDEHLDIDGCFKFLELVQILKPTLSLYQPPDTPSYLPLTQLPRNVLIFLEKSLDLEHESAKIIWEVLAPLAWGLGDVLDIQSFGRRYLQLFIDHGPHLGIAFYHFTPPTRVCVDPRCSSMTDQRHYSRELKEESSISVAVFTQDFGPIPGISSSFYCRGCHTRYYPDYWVENAANSDAKRVYYRRCRGIFDFIHVEEHVFVETRTLELFSTMMLNSWTSASNCARIYNDGLALKTLSPSLPSVYAKSFLLHVEVVWNGLFLYWLLEDAEEHEEILRLDHEAGGRGKRLLSALARRNLRMAGTGQPCWNHACEICCWIETQTDGTKTFVRATVTDGVTIGRPTCSVHNCDLALISTRDRYCQKHVDEDKQCVVTTCSLPAEKGHRTCTQEGHRALEVYNQEQNKAMFQLKRRLARLNTSQPLNSLPDPSQELPENFGLFDDQEIVAIDKNIAISDTYNNDQEVNSETTAVDETATEVCNDKPEEGNRTLRARFGRKRTHNEELCVTCCGVILGRATFYGSEGANGVREFWETLFPTRRSLPQVLFHDNNCRIAAMLRREGGEKQLYFSSSALPVDVFHFKSKHKESDEDCGRYCNPVLWPELTTPDGKWRFNSSAAEQANAWIGGYQSIVREMQKERYEFFLDEMIRRRNNSIIRDLQRKGKVIYEIPREELLQDGLPNVFH